jgi:serine/threonine-protein kinase RsbW
VCRDVRAFLAERGDAVAGFVVELVARECVNNAVLHGSRQDATKTVSLLLRRGRRHYCLRVADQGPGFAWRDVLGRPVPDDCAVRGRGIPILEMYASRIRFSPDGSCVTVWLARTTGER